MKERSTTKVHRSDGAAANRTSDSNQILKSGTVQRQPLVDGSSFVMRAKDLNMKANSKSTVQKKPNKTGLPDQLKSGIETLSGHTMDDVKVHYNSSKPAQLNAHAYAQGTVIHLAAGQEKHLPHEAWHVVQQKQGRVQPTMQLASTEPRGVANVPVQRKIIGKDGKEITLDQLAKAIKYVKQGKYPPIDEGIVYEVFAQVKAEKDKKIFDAMMEVFGSHENFVNAMYYAAHSPEIFHFSFQGVHEIFGIYQIHRSSLAFEILVDYFHSHPDLDHREPGSVNMADVFDAYHQQYPISQFYHHDIVEYLREHRAELFEQIEESGLLEEDLDADSDTSSESSEHDSEGDEFEMNFEEQSPEEAAMEKERQRAGYKSMFGLTNEEADAQLVEKARKEASAKDTQAKKAGLMGMFGLTEAQAEAQIKKEAKAHAALKSKAPVARISEQEEEHEVETRPRRTGIVSKDQVYDTETRPRSSGIQSKGGKVEKYNTTQNKVDKGTKYTSAGLKGSSVGEKAINLVGKSNFLGEFARYSSGAGGILAAANSASEANKDNKRLKSKALTEKEEQRTKKSYQSNFVSSINSSTSATNTMALSQGALTKIGGATFGSTNLIAGGLAFRAGFTSTGHYKRQLEKLEAIANRKGASSEFHQAVSIIREILNARIKMSRSQYLSGGLNFASGPVLITGAFMPTVFLVGLGLSGGAAVYGGAKAWWDARKARQKLGKGAKAGSYNYILPHQEASKDFDVSFQALVLRLSHMLGNPGILDPQERDALLEVLSLKPNARPEDVKATLRL